MSDHEDVTNTQKKAKSPEVLKQLRRSAKANLTRLLNKIEAKVKSLSSSDVIAILRENLTEQKDQTLLYHTKYVDSACLNDEQRIEARWAARVDDSAIATYKLIDDYLGSIITPEADPPSTQDGSPNGSQNFTQGDQTIDSSHAEAKRKRIATEKALQEAEREDEEYAGQAAEKTRKLQADVHKRSVKTETLGVRDETNHPATNHASLQPPQKIVLPATEQSRSSRHTEAKPNARFSTQPVTHYTSVEDSSRHLPPNP